MQDLSSLSYKLFSLNNTLKTLEIEKKELMEKIKFKMMDEGYEEFHDDYGNSLKYVEKNVSKIDKEGIKEYLGEEKFSEFVEYKKQRILMPYSKETKTNFRKMMRGNNPGIGGVDVASSRKNKE